MNSEFFRYKQGRKWIPYAKGEYKGIYPQLPEHIDDVLQEDSNWYDKLESMFGEDWRTKSELILYMGPWGDFQELADIERWNSPEFIQKHGKPQYSQEELDGFQDYLDGLENDGGITIFLMNCTKSDNIESRLKIVHTDLNKEIKINKFVYFDEDDLFQ